MCILSFQMDRFVTPMSSADHRRRVLGEELQRRAAALQAKSRTDRPWKRWPAHKKSQCASLCLLVFSFLSFSQVGQGLQEAWVLLGLQAEAGIIMSTAADFGRMGAGHEEKQEVASPGTSDRAHRGRRRSAVQSRQAHARRWCCCYQRRHSADGHGDTDAHERPWSTSRAQ
jgi:hypothetical protein